MITAPFATAVPEESVAIVVVFAVVTVLNHDVAVPFSKRVSVEVAEKSTPLIGTTVPALTAETAVPPKVVASLIAGVTVKLAVADAVPAVNVIV